MQSSSSSLMDRHASNVSFDAVWYVMMYNKSVDEVRAAAGAHCHELGRVFSNSTCLMCRLLSMRPGRYGLRTAEYVAFLVKECNADPVHVCPVFGGDLGDPPRSPFLTVALLPQLPLGLDVRSLLALGIRWLPGEVDEIVAKCDHSWWTLLDHGFVVPPQPPDAPREQHYRRVHYCRRVAARRTALALLSPRLLKSSLGGRIVGRDVMRVIARLVWAQRFTTVN